MKVYIFSRPADFKRLGLNAKQITDIFQQVAAGTHTAELVIALYLVRRSKWTGGTAYVREYVAHSRFLPRRGKWAALPFTTIPDDLPVRFKLIRMLLRSEPSLYPLKENDQYGWQHHYQCFTDHLAHLFAHELHHFRRYHLGLHPREGEQSANRWAANHVQGLGFRVSSRKIQSGPKRRKHKNKTKPSFHSLINPGDFYPLHALPQPIHWQQVFSDIVRQTSLKEQRDYIEKSLRHFQILRSLKAGSLLRIDFDPSGRYMDTVAMLIRPMRRNSTRIVIQTFDGKTWRWPMTWLKIEP